MESSEDGSGISDQAMQIFGLVVLCGLCQTTNIFGIVTNIINILCFAKQGFDESVNISLLGLSISDLGSLVTMVWTAVCITCEVMAVDLPFDAIDVGYMTTGLLHLSFTRVSSCITAMITLERCLCITAPLKVQSLITQKRTAMITVGVFIIFICSGTPVYAVNRLQMQFSLLKNKTLVGIVSTEDRMSVEMMSFFINSFLIPFGAFVIIVVCTAILSFQLRVKTRWRHTAITSSQVDRVSTRNEKVAKMVVMISSLFIVCFVPVTVIILVLAFTPSLSISGKYFRITLMMAGIGYTMESINSSMNIFMYYHMSSKYRQNFCKLFNKLTSKTEYAN